MTVRDIMYFIKNDEQLRRISKPILDFDDSLQVLIEDMFETMYKFNGIGLSAPQVGENVRLFVVDIFKEKGNKFVLINPEIIESKGITNSYEGCLSIPGIHAWIVRSKEITVRALDRFGVSFEKSVDGLLAECFQHEIDHLDGKLFIDFLSPLRQYFLKKKIKKIIKNSEKHF
ncbi:peptide deformylase [Candidatus Legionella polyplacis]|uniref:Peptide deformylase n=1 Tax=Candidatus Legionella polyplacis TaxID=2005262 RepID=A0ABZ2GW65_9GAMM|nr:peptide deformylase [Candidatus Legionella polyplacis]ATW01780.1 peptide deformylase [Candidatus Legionella polyplacis]